MSDKEQIEQQMNDLIKQAAALIDEAVKLGDANQIAPDFSELRIGDDMWYVSEADHMSDLISDLKYEYGLSQDAEPTQELLAEVEEKMKELRDNGGYDGSYKVIGWMSSSTNC